MFFNKGSYKLRNLDIRESKHIQHKIEVEFLDAETKQGSPSQPYATARISASIYVFLRHVTLTRFQTLGFLKVV